MSKVIKEHHSDWRGIPYIRMNKKRGSVSPVEAYEAIREAELFGAYLIELRPATGDAYRYQQAAGG